MSLDSKLKKTPKKLDDSAFVVPTLPQVNLLPIEIIQKRDLRVLQRKLGFYFALFVLVCAVVIAAFIFMEKQASNRLEAAHARTTELNLEQAKYAEVPLVLGQIETSEQALRDAMYREVLWADYVGAVATTLPDDGIISEFNVAGATPNAAGPNSLDSLQGENVGAITFTANLLEIPNVVEWIKALEEIPGFEDARIDSVSFAGQDDDRQYVAKGSVRFTDDAYSKRFEPKDEEVAN